MADIPANAPDHCPGTESEAAGKASACEGCPNQSVCTSLPKGPDPAIAEVKAKLSSVKHKILVLSGKGGVGKSTFTAHLAHGLAADSEKQIAVLDVDICGPSIPRILGVEGEQVHQSGSGWSPVGCYQSVIWFGSRLGWTGPTLTECRSQSGSNLFVKAISRRQKWLPARKELTSSSQYIEDNLCVMSVGFLLSGPDDAVIWRGPKKNGLIKQFLKDVDWGDIDYMVIDTPPGTSDEHLSIVQYLGEANVDGAIIVTTPQEISLQDVRKEINFCKKTNLPVMGIVENMSGFVCPKCKNESQIFPPTTGGGEKLSADSTIPLLGKLPLDPRIGKCCDEGKSYLTEVPDSPATKAFIEIIQKIKAHCDSKGDSTETETGETMDTS